MARPSIKFVGVLASEARSRVPTVHPKFWLVTVKVKENAPSPIVLGVLLDRVKSAFKPGLPDGPCGPCGPVPPLPFAAAPEGVVEVDAVAVPDPEPGD